MESPELVPEIAEHIITFKSNTKSDNKIITGRLLMGRKIRTRLDLAQPDTISQEQWSKQEERIESELTKKGGRSRKPNLVQKLWKRRKIVTRKHRN